MTQTAKVFTSGSSQFVLLPDGFFFDVDEIEIMREGDAVVLRARSSSDERWQKLIDALGDCLSEDFMANGREQPQMPPDDPNEMFD